MKIIEAKTKVELEINKLLGCNDFNLGALRDSEFYNDVLGVKIGNNTAAISAKFIVNKMTRSTTDIFNRLQNNRIT